MPRAGKAALLDTNVLLRFLLGDDSVQSPRATALMKRLEVHAEVADLEDAVLAETVWVLQRGARVPRLEIVRSLGRIVGLAGLRYLGGKRVLLDALASYGATNCDIVDCLLAARARSRGSKVYSFDVTDFKRLQCEWKEPG